MRASAVGGQDQAAGRGRRVVASPSQHPQFELGVVGHLLRVPWRIPYQIDVGERDPGHAADAQFDFGRASIRRPGNAAWSASSSTDGRAIIGHLDAIDQAKIVDVDRDFGIENLLERGRSPLRNSAPPGSPPGGSASGFCGKETFEVVALALEVFRLAHRILTRVRRAPCGGASTRRPTSSTADPAFFVHPKILVTLLDPAQPAPRYRLIELYTPKLARAVAGTPSASISGCAQ